MYLLRVAYGMSGGTIGGRLALALDGDKDRYVDTGEFMGECRAHGIRKKVKPEQIDQWGEQEFADRTVGTWGDAPICPDCRETIPYRGDCACGKGWLPPEVAVMVACGLMARPDGMEAGSILRPSEEVDRRPRPDWVPTAAELPDLPDDATPAEVAAWRERYDALQRFRAAQLQGTYRPKSRWEENH